jgi:hypothetical protein
MALQANPRKQLARGRVHYLASGVLLVIATMWISADRLMAGEPATAAQWHQANAAEQRAEVVKKARSVISEVKVTAPRLTEQDRLFVEPEVDVAVGEPDAPQQFWGDPS